MPLGCRKAGWGFKVCAEGGGGVWGSGRVAPAMMCKPWKGYCLKEEGSRLHKTNLWKEKRVLASVRPRREAGVIGQDSDEDSSWRWGLARVTGVAPARSWAAALESPGQRHLTYASVVTLAALWRAVDGAWGGQESSQVTHQEVDAGMWWGPYDLRENDGGSDQGGRSGDGVWLLDMFWSKGPSKFILILHMI